MQRLPISQQKSKLLHVPRSWPPFTIQAATAHMCMYILPLLLLGTSSCQLCSSFSLSLAQTTANYELMIPENLKATTTRRWIDLAILSLILRLLRPFPSLATLPYWFSRTDPFMRAVSMNNGLFYFYLALFCDFRSSVDQRIQLNQGVQIKASRVISATNLAGCKPATYHPN